MKIEHNGHFVSLFPNIDTVITEGETVVNSKFNSIVPLFRNGKWYGVYVYNSYTTSKSFSAASIVLNWFTKYCMRIIDLAVVDDTTTEFFKLPESVLEEIRNQSTMFSDYNFIKNNLTANQMRDLVQKVIEWGDPKGLTEYKPMLKSWPQYEKVREEIDEIATAIAHGDREGVKDGIGDSVTALILFATQNGWTIEECLEHAYNEIKDRTGKTVNGKFVKDGI